MFQTSWNEDEQFHECPEEMPACCSWLKYALFYFVVDKNGDVCISILHEPGEDKYGYEKPEERWLPIHTVETIMISVISMLADPNGDSPANVDAAVRFGLQLSSVQKPCNGVLFLVQQTVTSGRTFSVTGWGYHCVGKSSDVVRWNY